eukprot:scaffold37042_cov35-Prasinocladus_malaysianus.AAC.1
MRWRAWLSSLLLFVPGRISVNVATVCRRVSSTIVAPFDQPLFSVQPRTTTPRTTPLQACNPASSPAQGRTPLA